MKRIYLDCFFTGYKSVRSDLKLAKVLKQSASPVICRGGAIRFSNKVLLNQHLSVTDKLTIYN